MHAIKTVILIERSEDIQTALDWGKKSGGSVHFVGLYPDVAYFLEREGVEFSVMDNYFDVPFVNLFVSEKSRKLEKFCHYLDDQIRAKYQNTDVNSAYGCFSQIRILHDIILTHSMIIRNIILKIKPSSIRLYSGSLPREPTHHGEAFSRDESVYTLLLESHDWGVPVCVIPYRGEPTSTNTTPNKNYLLQLKGRVKSLVRQNNFLFNCGIVHKHHGVFSLPPTLMNVLFHRLKNTGGINVLLYGGGYNWDDCTRELFRCGITNIIRVDDEKILTEYQNADYPKEDIYDYVFEVCINSAFVRELVKTEFESIVQFFCRRLAELVQRSYNISRFTREYILSIHQKYHPKILLLSSRSTEIAKTIVLTSRKLEIPVISWQHGGTGFGVDPMMYHDELYGSDVHFVFGDCVANRYRKLCEEYPDNPIPEILPIGSCSLDNLKITSGKVQKTKTVLYITSYYHKNDHNVLCLDKSSPNEALWAIHKSFLFMAEKHQECKFIIKLHPLSRHCEPLESFIRDLGIKNVSLVVDEKSVVQLLNESDIIFIDSISTGILQALKTEKEIFVHTGFYKNYYQKTLDLLQKRAYFSNDPEKSTGLLHEYLSTKGENQSDPDVKNTEFLKCYGTYKNDGGSGKRAVDVIWEKIGRI